MEGDLGLELREKSLGTDLEKWARLPSYFSIKNYMLQET